jgi:hypothetical protein
MRGAEFVQRFLQIVAGALRNYSRGYSRSVRRPWLDRFYSDDLARHAHREQFGHALAMDSEMDLAALRLRASA